MEYISSDTNIWIDFDTIAHLELPFLLPYTYIMCDNAIEDELLSPHLQELESYGLQRTEYSTEELYLAEEYGENFPRLSIYDRLTLAIAKIRGITLMTGDKLLREVAKKEGVPLLGTIGILDQLLQGGYISLEQYVDCLLSLQKHNGDAVRLPKNEIEQRLKNAQK